MRSDVKVGVVLGLGVLAVLGWYFLRADNPQSMRLAKSDKGSVKVADATGKDQALPPPIWEPSRSKKSATPPAAKSPMVKPSGRTSPPAGTAAQPAARTNFLADSVEPSPVRPAGSAAPAVDRSSLIPSSPPMAAAAANTSQSVQTPQRRGNDKPPLVAPPKVQTEERPSAEPTAAATPSPIRLPVHKTETGTQADSPTTMPRLSESVSPSAAKPKEEEKERTHVVKKNDSLAILAEQYYGSQRYTAFLAKANPQVDPSRLKIGTKLRIPPLSATLAGTTKPAEPGAKADQAKAAPSALPTATKPAESFYTVKAGDSFYSIARSIYGNGERWRELHQLNKDICPEPQGLRVGMKLRLASARGEGKATTQESPRPKAKAKSKGKAGPSDKPVDARNPQ
jgi:nucleoid-associated protein YgaU